MSEPRYILALDQGTTSSRAMLFDAQGNVSASASREFKQYYPQPGWVEHDAEEIWESQRDVAEQVLAAGPNGKVPAAEIAAIGITNQRETVVLWDRATGKPLGHAIVWQCRRTAAMCDLIRKEGFSGVIQEKTGLVTDAYFSGTKIVWFLEHVPRARERAQRGELACGTIDAWLIWKLTRERLHVTDVSNASRTMLFNIHTLAWDREILQHFSIPVSLLPEVKPSSHIVAETDLFGGRIPIAGVAGDQQASLFGHQCFKPGSAKNTYGTGCFLLMNTGATAPRSESGLVSTIGWKRDGKVTYALEGSVFIAGAALQWLRDELQIIGDAAESEQMALAVPDTGGVYFVPAFVGLGAPHWDAYARGTIVGLTRGSTAAHIARAALESIAFQVTDVLTAMEADSGIKVAELRVDGGACANNLLMQTQADLLGVPVVRASNPETTAMGAAYLAGLAVGFYKSTDEISSQWGSDRTFEPKIGSDERQKLRVQWNK